MQMMNLKHWLQMKTRKSPGALTQVSRTRSCRCAWKITLVTLLSPSVMPQGLPAEKEALLLLFLDFYPNPTFEQYQEFSRITREPLLVCCSLMSLHSSPRGSRTCSRARESSPPSASHRLIRPQDRIHIHHTSDLAGQAASSQQSLGLTDIKRGVTTSAPKPEQPTLPSMITLDLNASLSELCVDRSPEPVPSANDVWCFASCMSTHCAVYQCQH